MKKSLFIFFQVDVSTWTKIHLENHLTRAHAWKKSKNSRENIENFTNPSYQVLCAPLDAEFWVNTHWDLNIVENFPIMTISSKDIFHEMEIPSSTWSESSPLKISKKRTVAAVPYCLDAGDMNENTTVTVSLCYPSQFPKSNSDR